VGATKQGSWYGHFTPNITQGHNCTKDGRYGNKCPSIDAFDCSGKAHQCWSLPNATATAAADDKTENVPGHPGECYCLFDMRSDKTEHVNVASKQPEALAKLLSRWTEVHKDPLAGVNHGVNS